MKNYNLFNEMHKNYNYLKKLYLKNKNEKYFINSFLCCAVSENRQDVLDMVINDNKNVCLGEAFCWAIMKKNYDIIKYLMSKNIDLHGNKDYAFQNIVYWLETETNAENLNFLKYIMSKILEAEANAFNICLFAFKLEFWFSFNKCFEMANKDEKNKLLPFKILVDKKLDEYSF